MICVSKEYEIKAKMLQEEQFFCCVELTFGGEGRGAKSSAGAGEIPSPPQ